MKRRNEQLSNYKRVWNKQKREKRKNELIKISVATALMIGAGVAVYSVVAFSAPEKPQKATPTSIVVTNTAYKVKPIEAVSIPYTATEKVVATPVETTPSVKSESKPKRAISEAEFEYIVKTVWAESGNQDELGQRYVTDCIINRKRKYKCKNYYDVIQAKNAFATYNNGAIEKAEPAALTYKVVKEELEHQTNSKILYFRTEHYHKFGTPCFKHGAHYFSK